MGVARDDLVANIARHVDSSVHLFEKWGLPIWKAEGGGYVHEGRWQLMINGESYKVIVAEAAKNHLGTENIIRARLHRRPDHEGRHRRRRLRFLRAREQVLHLQSPRHLRGDGWRRPRLQASLLRRRPRPRLVSALELRFVDLLHPEGRRRDDLPGSPFHSRSASRMPTVRSAPGSCSSSPARPTPSVASTWSSAETSSRTGSPTVW